MDCQRIAGEELVERYLNGRLEPAEQDDFEVHLLECRQCLERTEALQMAHASLREKAQAIRLLPAKPVWRLQWAWVAIAAAVIALCIVGFYQLRDKAPKQPQIVKQPSSQPAPEQSPTPQNATVEPHPPKAPGPVEQKQTAKKPESMPKFH
jgi:negative regulator of sigma E activity